MKISILIPCHNEEKSIEKCINSCLRQTVKPYEIIVVNDGSTDGTKKILGKFGRKIKVVEINSATGNKSYVQEEGLKHINGDVFITTDGDTILDKNFVKYIEEDYKDEKVVAVSGYVKSLKYNWLTACRAYEYAIGQNIHKKAQMILNYIFVIPGAAASYRTKDFKENIKFDHDTLTEDLDFTYKLHKGKHKIRYDNRAIVYTQDPTTIKVYINQVRRWFGGGCQNLIKHLDGTLIDDPRRTFELTLIYVEGLIFSMLMFVLPFINIVLSLKFLFYTFIMISVLTIYVAIKEKRVDLLMVPPFYTLLMYVNSAVFLEQFVKIVILRRKNLVWYHPLRVNI